MKRLEKLIFVLEFEEDSYEIKISRKEEDRYLVITSCNSYVLSDGELSQLLSLIGTLIAGTTEETFEKVLNNFLKDKKSIFDLL